MKITDVKVIPVNKFLFVKVFTDEGITGLGESGDWGFLLSSGEVIESFREYLIGKNPMDIEHHWEYMYRCFHFRGAAVMGALSAIDIALYDIKGKALESLSTSCWAESAGTRSGSTPMSLERASGSYWTTVWQKRKRDLPLSATCLPSWTSPAPSRTLKPMPL